MSKKSRNYGGHLAYGLDQGGGVFHARFQVAICSSCSDQHFIDLFSESFTPNTWYHVAASYDATTGLGSLYINGSLVASETKGSGLAYFSTSEPLNLGSSHYEQVYENYVLGLIHEAHVFDSALSASNITDLSTRTSISAVPVFSYTQTSSSTTITDTSGNGYDGSVMGVVDVNSCPNEDLDQDGYPAWDDCDDDDPNSAVAGTGYSEACAATSCKSIYDDGYSIGDGIYLFSDGKKFRAF